MIYMRGQARDYDQWRQLGNAGWGWDDVLPYFTRSEDHWQGRSAFHGAGGEWRVEPQRLSWAVLDAFRQAAAETGILPTEDFNTGDNEGCGYFQVNQRRGIRWTTAKGFLNPALKRPNLTVETHAQVLKLHLEGKRVAGVVFRRPDGTEAYAAAGEVVLAAGAVGSPPSCSIPASARPTSWPRMTCSRCTTCRGWARTCRTICNCAWSTRSRACRR